MRKIFLILIIGLAFFGCKDKDDDPQAEYREATITLNFGSNAYTIKVSGTLLASEWNGVPSKVESLLENAYPIGTTIDDADIQDALNTVFARTGANVIVENTTAYSNYKIIGDGITLFLRYSVLNSISTNTIVDAVNNGMLINKTHSD
jgi:hypothetical protein